eukprot:gnl/MRDRNA2_/MRDRNA2_73652_c0_seq1.p1 gnl/MRDRNA2_/MRDRNA2_73652_c0~~gnl/MRDRNA2_/MRDRNA2_73652_c0_seq1.p1  ORF type:complete len:665 (-),score=109.54 gnl/MRDRNA2_/MRDRNA2_73652_c0_seq1:42-2036(-)
MPPRPRPHIHPASKVNYGQQDTNDSPVVQARSPQQKDFQGGGLLLHAGEPKSPREFHTGTSRSPSHSSASGTISAHVESGLLSPKSKNSNLASQKTKQQYLDDIDKAKVTSAREAKKELIADETEIWTRGMRFQTIVGMVILCNAISLGVEADHGERYSVVFQALEHVFTAAFFMELVLRIWFEGFKLYFSDSATRLDFFLVVMSVTDVWIIAPLGGAVQLRAVSLLRLIRLIRLARLLRLFKVFKELTIIVAGFVASGRTLFWAGIFLVIIVYIFAILGTDMFGKATLCGARLLKARGGAIEDDGEKSCSDALYEFDSSIGTQASLFGSVDRSMLTLYMCVFEGCGFEIVYPMALTQPWTVVYWYVFIFITSFGIMNVIIGLFCENVLQVALSAEKDQARQAEVVRQERLSHLKALFETMDEDHSETISRSEFLNAMTHNLEVIQVMEELGLEDEVSLFDTLDVNQSGALSVSEFFQGMMLLMNANEPAMAKHLVSTYLTVQSVQHHVLLFYGDWLASQGRDASGLISPHAAAKITAHNDRLQGPEALLEAHPGHVINGHPGEKVPATEVQASAERITELECDMKALHAKVDSLTDYVVTLDEEMKASQERATSKILRAIEEMKYRQIPTEPLPQSPARTSSLLCTACSKGARELVDAERSQL